MKTTMKNQTFIKPWLSLGIAALFWAGPVSSQAQSQMFTTGITLEGKSAGGSLTLTRAPGWNYPYVEVENKPGSASTEVIARLALELGSSQACSEYYGQVQGIQGNVLRMAGDYRWVFGGTDGGFAIPPSPADLSVSYNDQTDEVSLRWENPPGGYDSVTVLYYSSVLAVLPGDATSYVHKRGGSIDAGFSSSDITVSVLGTKGDMNSNVLVTRLRKHNEQNVLFNVPFNQGLAPGFTAWSAPGNPDGLKLAQGNLKGMEPKIDPRRFLGKGFYQILEAQGEYSGGVSRTFTGLKPGHTYRVAARMNTLDSKAGDWAFSFHAAANASGQALTPDQLAGKASLPDGSKGPDAGLIARYDGNNLSSGAWVGRSTGGNASAADLVLPANSDSVTVWFRLSGAGDVSGVGLDSLSLADQGVQVSRSNVN